MAINFMNNELVDLVDENTTNTLPELRSIIANPQLTDPSIDVSSLRTTTPTRSELLAAVPEFSGLKYDPTERSYVEDLYALYGAGLPTIDVAQDTAQIPGAVDTLVDVGGGGGQNQVTGDSVAGFDPGVTPGPSGFIGLDPDMDIDPQDFAQEDYGIYDPPELGGVDGMSGGQATPGAEFADQNPYGGTGTMDDLGADTFDTMPQESPVATFGDTTTGLEDYVEGIDLTTGLPKTPAIDTTPDAPPSLGFGNAYEEPMSLENVIGTDANVGFVDTPEQQQGFLQDVLGRAGQTVEGALTELGKVPGAVVDFANQTVDLFGQKLNVGKTLASAAINKVVGGPISLVFDAIGALGIEGGPTLQTEKADSIGLLNPNATGGYQDKYGINTQSAFGDYDQYNIDRVEQLEDIVADQKKRNLTNTIQMQELEDRKEYNRISGVGGDITPNATPTDIATGNVTGDATIAEIIAQQDRNEIQPTDPSLDIPDRGRGDQDTGSTSTDPADDFDDGTMTGVAADITGDPIGGFFDAVDSAAGGSGSPSGGLTDAQAAANQDAARGGNTGSTGMSDAQAAANQDAARGGSSGGGGSGGKIVCTMMNDSYGFGSFRNKIWLRHSKDLAPEYQKGYHKIFLPLVKLSKNNKVLKKMLEHIAVHRTIDIRQESRGKVHLLGRVYRKILEPICYFVGKHG